MELGHQAWHQAQHCSLLSFTGLSSGFLKTVHSGTSETIVMTLLYPNLLKSLAVTWTLIGSCSQKCFLWSDTLIIWKTLAVCMCLCLNPQYWHIWLSHIKSHVSISLPRLRQEVLWARETATLCGRYKFPQVHWQWIPSAVFFEMTSCSLSSLPRKCLPNSYVWVTTACQSFFLEKEKECSMRKRC